MRIRLLAFAFIVFLIPDPAHAQLGFDFAVDSLRVVGNIPGGFFDDFNDGSLTTFPTSELDCSGTVHDESGGFLHLTSSDGANTFTPGFLIDNCGLGLPLHDGAGNAVITVSFRADVPLPGQQYGLTLYTLGTNEGMNITVGPGAYVSAIAGFVQSVPINLSGVARILLRFTLDDSTNHVTPSFSIDGGSTFTPIPLPAPVTIFTTANQAVVSVFGAVEVPINSPLISALSPTSGPVGTLVTITGSNFGATQGTTKVTFGSTVATVSSWSDTHIKVTVPSLSAGTHDVVVITSAGSSEPVVFKVTQFGLQAGADKIWANGHEQVELTVSVTDASGHGVPGRRVHLSANPMTGVTITPRNGNAVTDTLGKAHFVATSTKIGPVVFTATDVRNTTLMASAQVEFIQRRVVVFVQGINTELNDTTKTADTVFPEIRQLLIDKGFSRPSKGTPETGKQCANSLTDFNHADDDGDGVPDDGCPLILVYSYKDGHVNNTTGLWFPNSYTCNDTGNRILASIVQLTRLMRKFATRNPNTRFILIGHSQGGLIALQAARFMSRSVPIDTLITLDGALGGAPQSAVEIALAATCWGFQAASNLVRLWNSTTNHADQGTNAIAIGQDNATTVASLQKAQTKVVTIGSWDDCVWDPNRCGVLLDFNTSTQIIRHADVVKLFSLGGNCPFDIEHPIATSQCVTDSHSRVYHDPQVLEIIGQTIGFPTVP